jgi:hypothetical protein
MTRPIIFADFEHSRPDGALVLKAVGSRQDLERLSPPPEVGMAVTVASDELIAEGVLDYSQLDDAWVARIDWTEVMYRQSPGGSAGLTGRLLAAEKPRIFADFENGRPDGSLRLNTVGSLADLAALPDPPREGMEVEVACDDLVVDAVLEYDQSENAWFARVDWRRMWVMSPTDE